MIKSNSEHRIIMKKKARTIRGLASVLQDDAEYIRIDTEDFDLVGLSESIREGKETVNLLLEHMADLENLMYLARNAIGGMDHGPERTHRR